MICKPTPAGRIRTAMTIVDHRKRQKTTALRPIPAPLRNTTKASRIKISTQRKCSSHDNPPIQGAHLESEIGPAGNPPHESVATASGITPTRRPARVLLRSSTTVTKVRRNFMFICASMGFPYRRIKPAVRDPCVDRGPGKVIYGFLVQGVPARPPPARRPASTCSSPAPSATTPMRASSKSLAASAGC